MHLIAFRLALDSLPQVETVALNGQFRTLSYPYPTVLSIGQYNSSSGHSALRAVNPWLEFPTIDKKLLISLFSKS